MAEEVPCGFFADAIRQAPSLLREDAWVAFPETASLLAMEQGHSAVRRPSAQSPGPVGNIFEWRRTTNEERKAAIAKDVEWRKYAGQRSDSPY
jgi:hypothetical protein